MASVAATTTPNTQATPNTQDKGDSKSDTKTESKDCSICYKSLDNTNMIITPCTHAFCNECFFKWLGRKESCAMCRKTLLTNEQVEEREQLLDEINEDVARELSYLNQTRATLKKKKKKMQKIEKKANDLMDRQIRLRQMLDHTRALCIDSMKEHEEIEKEISTKKTSLKLMSSYRKDWEELYGKNDDIPESSNKSTSAGEKKEKVEEETPPIHHRGRNTRLRFTNRNNDDNDDNDNNNGENYPMNERARSYVSVETAVENVQTEIERLHFNSNVQENEIIDLTHSSDDEVHTQQTPTQTTRQAEDEQPQVYFSFDWRIFTPSLQEEESISTRSITPPPMENYASDSDEDIDLNSSSSQLSSPPSPPSAPSPPLTPQYSSEMPEEKQSDPIDQLSLATSTPLPNDSSTNNSDTDESKQSDDVEYEEGMYHTPPRRNTGLPRMPGAPLRLNIPRDISNFFDTLNLNPSPHVNLDEQQPLPENIFVFGAAENNQYQNQNPNSNSNSNNSPPPPQMRRRVLVRRNRNRINSRHRVSFHNEN